jgi:serine/threonine-protein kinase
MASPVFTIHGRYQLGGKPIGQGGMGLVYKAYDTVTRRHVALKTMRGSLSAAALELFSKEWTVLAQLSHPNIVDVLDTGEFEQDGETRPFFVMPFLPGSTLEQLMQNASPRLTLERVVGIVAQTCRGLQAAHEHGLIHRDLKPSNIFVLDDDSVKVIDFGIVHLAGADSIQGLKGTLQYMAPEQVEMKPGSAASDVFSLAVVCYEALTSRKPFARRNELETAEAIRRHIPPPICDLNPLVSQLVSRVIHKALAKEPWHRFSSAREFADSLQKALKGEAPDRFDRAKIQPRIDRAKKAQVECDHQFASEILAELEAEGNIDPEMSLLRIQIDHAIRQKSIRQLLDNARTRLEEDEFPLALQKIQEVLEIDPENSDAIHLRSQIEKQRSQKQIENWFRLVQQHIHNQSFGQARQGLEEILKLKPNDTRARELLQEVERKEQEVSRLRGEKEQLYQSALSCYNRGEVSSALTKLERILDLTRRSPDSAIPDRDAQYQSLYNQIRTERDTARNAYAEGRRYLADRNFSKALEICNDYLKKSPDDPLFKALKLEVEEHLRQEQSAFIADVSRRVEAEPDLDRRVNILKEAVERYPEEAHLQQSLRLVRERRDLVNSIVGRARQYEEREQFNEALGQFDILRNIYAQYPGIDFETERLKRRREQQVRDESKSRWVEQVDRHIALGDYARALDLVRTAMAEFPDDRELMGLERLAETALKRAAEAEEWLQRGQQLCFDRQFADGLEALRKAASLDNRNVVIRAALLNALVEQARSVLGQDWRAAEPLIEQALSIDGGHPLARSLQGLVLDYKRQEIVNECVSQARELQTAGNLSAALAKVEEVMAAYPNEIRLAQLRATLLNLGAVSTSHAVPQAAGVSAKAEASPAAREAVLTETVPLSEARPSVADYTFTVDQSMVKDSPVAPSPTPARKPPRRTAVALPGARSPIESLLRISHQQIPRIKSALQKFAEPAGHFLTRFQWGIIGIGFAVLVLGLVVTLSKKAPKPATPAVVTEYEVALESNVPSVKYLVDGNPPASLPLRLRAGSQEHKVEASAPGYKPAAQYLTLTPASPKSSKLSFQLEPELVRLRLNSDLKSGQVSLDGQSPEDLQDGGFAKDGLALSLEHTVSLLQFGQESLAFSFRAEPGGLVTLASPTKSKDLSTVLIASLASRAMVYATDRSLRGGLKDTSPAQIPDEGLPLNALGENAEFVVDNGKATRPLPIEAGNAPTLTVWLASDPNFGNITVEANVLDGEIVIDGRKLKKPLHPGKNYLALQPGMHKIQLSKEGYEPAVQDIEVKKGDLLRLPAFVLKLVARTASLVIDGATRDAEVWIAGAKVGNVQSDGSFRWDNVTPGEHTVLLKRGDFEDRQFSKTFTAGQTVHLSGQEGQLTAWGTLDFRISPQSASVTYRRSDETPPHSAENGRSVRLKQGSYTVSASADKYGTRFGPFTVEPGKTTAVDWTLSPTEPVRTAPPPPPPPAPDPFQDPKAWSQEGVWKVHKEEGMGWLRANQGEYRIEILRQTTKILGIKKATKRVDWVIDQKDQANHIDYSFDFSNVTRRVTVGGKQQQPVKKPVAAGSGESYTLRIEIGQARIVIRDAQGKEVDRYDRPNSGDPLGQFGFRGDVALVLR